MQCTARSLLRQSLDRRNVEKFHSASGRMLTLAETTLGTKEHFPGLRGAVKAAFAGAHYAGGEAGARLGLGAERRAGQAGSHAPGASGRGGAGTPPRAPRGTPRRRRRRREGRAPGRAARDALPPRVFRSEGLQPSKRQQNPRARGRGPAPVPALLPPAAARAAPGPAPRGPALFAGSGRARTAPSGRPCPPPRASSRDPGRAVAAAAAGRERPPRRTPGRTVRRGAAAGAPRPSLRYPCPGGRLASPRGGAVA